MAIVAAREAVFAAMAAQLDALLAEPVERNRTDAVPDEECPRVVLLDGDHDVGEQNEIALGLVRYNFQARLVGYVAPATDAQRAAAASDLHARCVAALMTNSTTLGAPIRPIVTGGAEIWVRELGARFAMAGVEDSEVPFASFVALLLVQIDLPEGSPFLDI